MVYSTAPECRTYCGIADDVSTATILVFQTQAAAIINGYVTTPNDTTAKTIELMLVRRAYRYSLLLKNYAANSLGLPPPREYEGLTKEMKRMLKKGKVNYGKKPIDGPNPGDTS